MITDERLKWLSSADYAASEPGQIAGELLTARARIAQLEAALLELAKGKHGASAAWIAGKALEGAASETKGEQSEV
jgi:hypothetical protein